MPIQNLARLLILINLLSCTRDNSLKHFYSNPSFKKHKSVKNSNQVMLLITSGFKGQLESMEESFPGLPLIKVGGKDFLTSYVDISREKYPNLLFLDGGGIFNSTSGDLEKTINFYDSLAVDAIALGDEDLFFLKGYEGKIKLPFLNSNFMDIQSGKSHELEGLRKTHVFKRESTKIAVYSLMYPKKYSNFVEGINVLDPVFTLLQEKALLEREEIDINVLMLSIDTGCLSEAANQKMAFNEYADFQLKCPQEDELLKFVSRLPPKFIDLIILNNNAFASGFIEEIPIIQNPGRGKFIGRVNLVFDNAHHRINREKSEILPPIKTCHHFFIPTQDCHLGKSDLSLVEQKRLDLILQSGNKIGPAIYLGEKLQDWTDSVTN